MRSKNDLNDFEQKFWDSVDIKGEDDCWEWKGPTDKKGYGILYVNGKKRYAHEIAFELAHGIRHEGDMLDFEKPKMA